MGAGGAGRISEGVPGRGLELGVYLSREMWGSEALVWRGIELGMVDRREWGAQSLGGVRGIEKGRPPPPFKKKRGLKNKLKIKIKNSYPES